jgi:hypothetical protein
MTKAEAQHIILDSVVELVRATDNPLLWEALYTLCPHLEYIHGGSMGLVCSVCGAMPPDADVPDDTIAAIDQHAALKAGAIA